MVNASIVRAEETHVGQLLRKGLRDADRLELYRASGMDDADALADSFHLSTDRYAILVDGLCIAMFGVCPDNLFTDTGVVWMLTSKEVETYWLRFARMSKRTVEILFDRWAHLYNWVDAENEVSLSWLKWLGFDVSEDTVAYGPFGCAFHYFENRGDV